MHHAHAADTNNPLRVRWSTHVVINLQSFVVLIYRLASRKKRRSEAQWELWTTRYEPRGSTRRTWCRNWAITKMRRWASALTLRERSQEARRPRLTMESSQAVWKSLKVFEAVDCNSMSPTWATTSYQRLHIQLNSSSSGAFQKATVVATWKK